MTGRPWREALWEPKKHPTEMRERAGRLYVESEPRPVVRRLAEQLGIHHEALRTWIRQAQAEAGASSMKPVSPAVLSMRNFPITNRRTRYVRSLTATPPEPQRLDECASGSASL